MVCLLNKMPPNTHLFTLTIPLVNTNDNEKLQSDISIDNLQIALNSEKPVREMILKKNLNTYVFGMLVMIF